MLYKSLMAERGSNSRQGRGRPKKHGLPPCTYVPPTTSAALASNTLTIVTTSIPPSHPPHTQEFIMILNIRYVEPGPQPLFPLSLLHLHPYLQEVRPTLHQNLVPHLPLSPVTLVQRVLKPPCPPL